MLILLRSLILSKAEQLSLFDMPVHVAASTDKNGVTRAAHMSIRKKRVPAPVTKRSQSRLDDFIAKHGGPAHLNSELEKMTPEQRAKLIDAMAHVDGVSHDDVMAKLNPVQGDLLTMDRDEAIEEHERLVRVLETPSHADDQQEAKKQAEELAKMKAPGSAPEIVEHVTRKGKTLRGVVRSDLSAEQAKAIDEYTFKKDGGWFIREKHLEVADKLDAAKDAGVISAEQHVAARAGAAKDGAEGAMIALDPLGAAKRQADKMRATAQTLADKSQESLSRDRLANTARRARMAASSIAESEKDAAIARTMFNLADAIESGEAKHLSGVKNGADVRMLDSALVQGMYERDRNLSYADQQSRKGRPPESSDIEHAVLPRSKWDSGGANPSKLIDLLKGKRGAPAMVAEIRRSPGPSAELMKKLKAAIDEKEFERNIGWWNVEAVKRLSRYERMGITSDADLRAALGEYLAYRDGPKKPDPVKEAERAIVGQKVGIDFFPTPKALAAKMAQLAGVQPGMKVLEPSAGNGHLADAAREAGGDVDTLEVSHQLRDILAAKGHKIVGHDFETHDAGDQYDAVIMNPPFSDRKDALHIERAWSAVKPGGKLVAIAGEGVFFGTDKRAIAFRAWLDKNGAEVEKLPENTFKGADLPAQTGANARLIVMEKPAVEPRMKNYGWDAVKLSDAYSFDELNALRKQVEVEHANPFTPEGRYTEKGQPSIHVYDKAGRKKLEKLAWAVTYKLQEKSKNPEVDLAEDRADLAEEMIRNPHSDKARALIHKISQTQDAE